MTDFTTPESQDGLVEQYRLQNNNDCCEGHHSTLTHLYEWGLEHLYHPCVRRISGMGEHFVGRANAGRLGTASRIIRWGVIAIYATAFALILTQLGVLAFFTGGLPIWLIALPYIGLGLSTVAILLGTAGNTLKIEQYYDYELELLAEANLLRAELLVSPDSDLNDPDLQQKYFPHTLNELKAESRSLWRSRIKRKVHDANGILGTILGTVTTGFDLLTKVVGTCLVVVSPLTAFVMYSISRVSTLLSVTFAPYTNWERLKENKKVIDHYENDLLKLAARKSSTRVDSARESVDKILASFKMDRRHFYTKRVRANLIMTLFRHPEVDIAQAEEHIKKLIDSLRSKKPNKQGQYLFDRTAIRKLDMANKYTPKASGFSWRNHLAPLDAMPILGYKLLDAYYNKTAPSRVDLVKLKLQQLNIYFPLENHVFSVQFLNELRFTLLALPATDLQSLDVKCLSARLREYCVHRKDPNKWCIDPETVADSFPTGNAIHSRLAFVPHYHSKRLVATVISAATPVPVAEEVDSKITAAKDLIVKSLCTPLFKKKCNDTLEAMRAKRVTKLVGEKRLAKNLEPLLKKKGRGVADLDKGLQRVLRRG